MHISMISIEAILQAIDHLLLGRPVISLLLISGCLFLLSEVIQRAKRSKIPVPTKAQMLHQGTEDGSL
ncbi:hypothetical protein [Terriglobus albidus]|uniref:hypothetical protein n=1 Tax=Terriglobus albidus TaxID=1592106 RepID=UPI00164D2256|nr:hypothetical protein [Terriglobus albidus]